VKQYRLPQVLRDAYRDRDLILPRARPYSEIVRDLDAVAAMPEVADPQVQALLARDRLRFLHYCADVSDEEIERVLQSQTPTLATMSTSERRWTLQNVTWGRRDLAERYLGPMLAETEDESERNIIENALSVARGESQAKGYEREGAWDFDFGLMVAHSGTESESERLASRNIRYAYRLQQLGWPYEEVLTAWDELTAEPRDAGVANWIVHNRLMVTVEYQRPAEDMEHEIQRAMQVFARQPIKDWAHMISSACSTYPTLAEKYLPPLIAEFEEELREQPDPDDQRELDYIRDDLEHARSRSS
jgi:hypothetical protein